MHHIYSVYSKNKNISLAVPILSDGTVLQAVTKLDKQKERIEKYISLTVLSFALWYMVQVNANLVKLLCTYTVTVHLPVI